MFNTNWIYPEDSSRQPRNRCRCSRHRLLVCCAINGTSIKAAVPAVTMDALSVRWNYTTYNSYPGYPTYGSYCSYPTYDYPGFSYVWW